MTTKFCLAFLRDASLGLYPDNTSNFQVLLPRPVELLELLQGSWEVGLSEVDYPKHVYGA